MITPLYRAEGYVQSSFDREKKLLAMKIFNLNLEIHRQRAFEVNIAAIEKYKLKTIILDGSHATGHHHPSDAIWITNTALPEYKAKGIRLIIYIFPENSVAKLAARTWLTLAEKFGFDFLEAHSLDEAYKYIKSYR